MKKIVLLLLLMATPLTAQIIDCRFVVNADLVNQTNQQVFESCTSAPTRRASRHCVVILHPPGGCRRHPGENRCRWTPPVQIPWPAAAVGRPGPASACR